ncbi:MAG: hypothetical protein ACI4D7_02560 [Lachnospiraceae bacterium]|nr:hypothetical protein [Lachnospiraceae bacterium]
MNAQEKRLIAKYERVLQKLTELNEQSEKVIDQLELEIEGYKDLCTCLTEKNEILEEENRFLKEHIRMLRSCSNDGH